MGRFACVAAACLAGSERAHNSKRIFNLPVQLIAIETAVNDLSITPTVRVIQ